MNRKKYIVLSLIILLILAIIMSVLLGWRDITLKISSAKFSKFIEQESLDDLTLTIYYMHPFNLTPFPVSVNALVDIRYENKIIIKGNELMVNIELLGELSTAELKLVKHVDVEARLYYVFETNEDGKIFDVAFWGSDNSIIVNGIAVEKRDIFYDFIAQYLPEDAARDFGYSFGRFDQPQE